MRSYQRRRRIDHQANVPEKTCQTRRSLILESIDFDWANTCDLRYINNLHRRLTKRHSAGTLRR